MELTKEELLNLVDQVLNPHFGGYLYSKNALLKKEETMILVGKEYPVTKTYEYSAADIIKLLKKAIENDK